MKEHFVEGRSGKAFLPTEDPAIFDVFLKWAYSRRLSKSIDPEMLAVDEYIETLCKVWIFADAHEVPLLQNEAIDLLHQKILEHWQFGSHVLGYLYEHTATHAQLRRYYMKVMADTGSMLFLVDREDEWSKEALVDVLKSVWRRGHKFRSKEHLKNWDLCEFHVHEEGVKCPK